MLTTENCSTGTTVASNSTADVVIMPVKLNRGWIEQCGLARRKPVTSLVLDFAATESSDSAGMALIYYLNRICATSNKKLILRNISASLHQTLVEWYPPESLPTETMPQLSYFAIVRNRVAVAWSVIVNALSMLTEILYWGTFGMLKRRDFRQGVFFEQMFQLGYKSLGIVCLLSFLVGIVLALQAAMQLEQFGAGIFLAPMIAISMIRELGPLLTAIIISGRNGSATTAEIATMVVGEEIDALQTMGINPVQFIVVPKFWAMTITMPLLCLGSTIVGIVGGYVVAVTYLGISSALFVGELLKNIVMQDVCANFIKSIVFSWLIIWVGAFYGFKVKGGAEEVGRQTTASVVTCIFIVIVADALFSFII
jgi:phospholipid/cholesterol/gamma-HCH transport system permease protein